MQGGVDDHDNLERRVARGEAAGGVVGGVGRVMDAEHDLEVGVGLGGQAVERLVEAVLRSAEGAQDGEGRPGTRRGRRQGGEAADGEDAGQHGAEADQGDQGEDGCHQDKEKAAGGWG